jgi:RHS repeat-associated protein
MISRPSGSSITSCSDYSDALARSYYTYDDLGRLFGEYTLLPGGAWSQRLHGYNGMGWKTWESTWQTKDLDPASIKKVVSSAFDPFGRPATITPPDDPGHVVDLSYTGERLTTKTVSIATGAAEESVVTSTEQYDAMGRLYKLQQPAGAGGAEVTTTYTYDVAGRLTKAVNPAQVRSWSYDGRGFLTSESVPEKGSDTTNGTVTYSGYNVRGQATQVIDGDSDLTSVFDDAGRLLTVSETATPTNVLRSLSYATANSAGNLAKGKLVSAESMDANNFKALEALTYGGVDGRISKRTTLAGASNQNTFTLDLTWSPLGKVASVTYPQIITGVAPTRTVTNTYEHGVLTRVAEGTTNYASEITYHNNGAINRVTYGNQVWVEHAKDPDDMSRPRSITMGNAGIPWTTGDYLYDGAGNIKAMGADTFRYDKVNRLAEANIGSHTQSYTYDAYANLTSITTDDAYWTIAVLTPSNRISGAIYDSSGNMTSWGSYSYTYDQLNQMSGMTGAGRNTIHGYSAAGERIATYDNVEDGVTYTLRGLDNKPLRQYFETLGGWSWRKDWIWRDGLLLATVDDTGTRYFHLDHLGTPRRVTNENGTVVSSYRYLPFGEEIEPIPIFSDGFESGDTSRWTEGTEGEDTKSLDAGSLEVVRFTGHERDIRDLEANDDLDYMHARYYNPFLGRFLNVDPVGGSVGSSQSWNRYSYVLNNPLSHIDPDGKQVAVVATPAGPVVLFLPPPPPVNTYDASDASSLVDWIDNRVGDVIFAAVVLGVIAEQHARIKPSHVGITVFKETLQNEDTSNEVIIDDSTKTEDWVDQSVDDYDGTEESEDEIDRRQRNEETMKKKQNERRRKERAYRNGDLEGDPDVVLQPPQGF